MEKCVIEFDIRLIDFVYFYVVLMYYIVHGYTANNSYKVKKAHFSLVWIETCKNKIGSSQRRPLKIKDHVRWTESQQKKSKRRKGSATTMLSRHYIADLRHSIRFVFFVRWNFFVLHMHWIRGFIIEEFFISMCTSVPTTRKSLRFLFASLFFFLRRRSFAKCNKMLLNNRKTQNITS